MTDKKTNMPGLTDPTPRITYALDELLRLSESPFSREKPPVNIPDCLKPKEKVAGSDAPSSTERPHSPRASKL